MTRIAIIADVHLGLGGRQSDILNSLCVVRDYCYRECIDHVFVLGDLFHDRQAVSTDVMCQAYDFFKGLQNYQQWIAFPGNHDMFLKHSWEVNSLKPLSEVLTIINDVRIVKIGPTRFWILPFIYSETAYMRILEKIEEQREPNDILLTHIGACAAVQNVCFLLQNWSVVDFSHCNFDRIYAGHFHLKQRVGTNLWYPGSILPYKFDEGDSDHGFYVYDCDNNKHRFVNIWDIWQKDLPKPPQYHTFHDDLLDEKTEDEVDGNMIRVATTKIYSQDEREQIRARLKGMGAKLVTFFDMIDDDTPEIDTTQTEILKATELFARWYDSDTKGTKGLTRNLAIRLNSEIVQEGDEQYVSQLD